MLTCAWCGTAGGGDAALTWALSVEDGAPRRYCPACAREHARAIEAKLDSPDWW